MLQLLPAFRSYFILGALKGHQDSTQAAYASTNHIDINKTNHAIVLGNSNAQTDEWTD